MNNSKMDTPNFSLEQRVRTGVMQLAGQFGESKEDTMKEIEEDLQQALKEGIPQERVDRARQIALETIDQLKA